MTADSLCAPAAAWPLACPKCRSDLGALPAGDGGPFEVKCSACGLPFPRRAGVWDFLPPDRQADLATFLDQYTRVRYAEGRGELTAEGLRRLPWPDPDDPLAWQWYIRATSFEHLLDAVMPLIGQRSLSAIDLGAGTGWLSYRLALEGHVPLAVDLSVDARDGLAAARAFDGVLATPFSRMRAEFDRLPLSNGAADLVVFNASLHYSSDYAVTLAEALRVLVPGGRVVIMDSPIYHDRRAGEAMVAARRADFLTRFGFRSDALRSREFVTYADLGQLGRDLGLRWREFAPPYGWRWALRRGWRRARTGRESARFAILLAEHEAPA